MNETTILQRIRLALGRIPNVKLFRNNVGGLKDAQGRYVQFGLHPGSGDLIGWKSVTVTPDMVGHKVAVFVSLEVKTESGKVKPDQINWLHQVNEAGGIAAVVRDPDAPLTFLR